MKEQSHKFPHNVETPIYFDPADPIDTSLREFHDDVTHDRLPTIASQRNLMGGVKQGNKDSLRQFIRSNKGFIAAVAYPFKGLDASDKLFVKAADALLGAAKTYSLGGEYDFSDHAITSIQTTLSEQYPNVDKENLSRSPRSMDELLQVVNNIREVDEEEARMLGRTSVSKVQLEKLENMLGFYPYGDETQVDTSENGEFIVPQDFRIHLIEKMAEQGLTAGDIIHAQALKRLEHHAVAELDDTTLFEYQQKVVRSIKSFLQYPEYDKDNQPIQHGYVKLPTATGKTAIYAHIVQEITDHLDSEKEHIKTLVLVPGRDLIDQTIGSSEGHDGIATNLIESTIRGFAKFAPNKTVTEYHGGKKDLSGEVVVMTYQSMNKAIAEGRIDFSMFDLFIEDEVHRALGTVTSRNLHEITKDKIAIGFSATTEYAENKTVADLLPTQIYRLELRNAVEKGYLAPIRALAITTDSKITASGYGEFKEAELEKLIKANWRNQTAIKIAKEFVGEGQQGIISCVPGQDCAHAKQLAVLLSKEQVVDAQTGEMRSVVAEAITGEMSAASRKSLYERYEAGQIDVLTYVDILNEGWDSTNAKFLINLRPTTSPVLATQRLGRILRPDEHGQIATVIEFIDDIEKPGDNIFTFYQAMHEHEITLGKIYGRSNAHTYERSRSPQVSLPSALQDLIQAVNYKLLDERIFGANILLASKTERSFNSFAKEQGISRKIVTSAVEKLGLELENRRFTTVIARALNKSQQEQILEFLALLPAAEEGAVSITRFCKEMGMAENLPLQAMRELGFEPEMCRIYGKPSRTLTKEQQVEIKEYLKFWTDVPAAAPEERSTKSFSEELGVAEGTISRAIKALKLELEERRFHTQISPVLKPADQIALKEYLSALLETPKAKKGEKSVNVFIKELGIHHPQFRKLAAELEIHLEKRRFGSVFGNAITADDQDQVRQHLQPYLETQLVREGEVSIKTFSKDIHASPSTIYALVNELNIKLEKRKFYNSISDAITPEQRKQLIQHLKKEA